jgi:molybdopterin molybdotransferase
VPRSESAGRITAETLTATIDVPASDVSAMDGYAVPAEAETLARLPVRGVVAAGDAPGAQLEPGTALRIMTGAPVPDRTDRVVPIELTNGGKDEVEIRELPPAGAHIRRRGEVTSEGSPLFGPGTLITDGALGLLASHGLREVKVVRRPSLAMITTGDEVVPPEVEPGPGQLRDSHSDFFGSVGRRLASSVELLGIAGDDWDQLRAKVERGQQADVLILTGGVSMGEFDLVEDVLEGFGCEVLFDAVAIQPGKPMVVAVHDGGWVFALPGNPASALVTFYLFVRPALRRLQGFDDRYGSDLLRGRLVGPLPGAKGRDRFLPAEVGFREGRIDVRPVVPQGSHDVAAYGRGTALVRIPARSEPAEPGAECEVLPLGDWSATLG